MAIVVCCQSQEQGLKKQEEEDEKPKSIHEFLQKRAISTLDACQEQGMEREMATCNRNGAKKNRTMDFKTISISQPYVIALDHWNRDVS